MSIVTNIARSAYQGVRNVRGLGRSLVRGAALAMGVAPSALVKFDWIQRPHYALPLLLASKQAQRLGLKGLTVIELGVGAGGGMTNLSDLTTLFRREFDLDYRVIGLDSGGGLPDPRDYRDHPEIWRGQQFVHDKEQLRARLGAHAKVVYGEVRETSPQVFAEVDEQHPIGFVVVDLDYYSSTRDALEALMRGPATRYLPAVMMYADDVDMLLTFNSYCGEELAFREFNEKSADRKIERKHVRTSSRPQSWHRRIFCCHVLDHPARHAIGKNVFGEAGEITVVGV